MAEQLGLFAIRAPSQCQRQPGPLCRQAAELGCPGSVACEALGEQETERIRAATTAHSVRPGDLTRCGGPETSAPTDTLVGGQGDQSTTARAADTAPVPHGARSCGSCGSTTGAVLYERGPLAGMRRCWTCAKPVLMEESHA